MALAGRLAKVHVASTPVPFINEATVSSQGNTVFTIVDTGKLPFDMNSVVTVEEDGVPVTSGFTVNRIEGTATFITPPSGVITFSASAVPTTLAGEAYEYSLSINAESLDATKFQDSYKSKNTGMLEASGTISQWKSLDTTFIDELTNGNYVYLELYPEASGTPHKLFALLDSDEVSASINANLTESISFSSHQKCLV